MSDKPKLSGSITISEGNATAPSMPNLDKTDIAHIPTYKHNSATDISANTSLSQGFDALTATLTLTGEYSLLNKGLQGKGLEGTSTFVKEELTIEPKDGPISSVYLWNSRKGFDFKGVDDFNLKSYGGFVAAKPIDLGNDKNLALGAGARFGDFDPAMAHVSATFNAGKKMAEVGYVHSLANLNDQVFAGVGYNGDTTTAQLRQYVDVNSASPDKTNRTQIYASHKFSDTLTGYSYGTVSESDKVRLQEAVIGLSKQITKSVSTTLEAGVTRGVDPKSDLAPTVQAGVKVSF